MLADLLPLMTGTVQHWQTPVRDVFARVIGTEFSEHRARVIYSPGSVIAAASRQNMADAAATVWLIDHPRPIAIGDTFKLPAGETLKAVRVERRATAGAVLSKVYLS
jgi:hypothetical protein